MTDLVADKGALAAGTAETDRAIGRLLGAYVLDAAGSPSAASVSDWAAAQEAFGRADLAGRPHPWRVGRDDLGPAGEVSTVFLGLDHAPFGRGDPVLWETLVFGGPLDGHVWRYRSRAEAERGHADAAAACRAAGTADALWE